jgi:hypothetical protein
MAASSSARRRASRSGSKVITDPGKLGPDLLEPLRKRLAVLLGHSTIVPGRSRTVRPLVGYDAQSDVDTSCETREIDGLGRAVEARPPTGYEHR